MTPLQHTHYSFGLRTGARLELPATDLTAHERIVLLASIASALELDDIGIAIRAYDPDRVPAGRQARPPDPDDWSSQ